MDEVHYLGDRFRGAVWEEAIIHLPESVQLVSLSATVSNAEEFGDWLISVRGDTKVVVHEQRPVPLWQHLLVGSRLFDLFDAGRARPDQGRRAAQALHLRTDAALRRRLAAAIGDRGRGRDRAGGAGLATAGPARRHHPARTRRAAARDHLHLQPGRLRCRGPPVPQRRPVADERRGTRRDQRDRREPHRGTARRGPRGPRLLGLARRAAPRRRHPSRRHGAAVQRDGRGAVRSRT